MISHTSEYTYANVLTLKIMRKLANNKEFEEFKRIEPSDIINLALNVLSIVIDEHDNNTNNDPNDVEIYNDLIKDNGKFAYYSLLSFVVSKVNNQELNELFLKASENGSLESIQDKLNGDAL